MEEFHVQCLHAVILTQVAVCWCETPADFYSGVPNRSAALNSSATRNDPQKLIIVPPLIEVPLGKGQVYRYEFSKENHLFSNN